MQFEITLKPIGKRFTSIQEFLEWLDFITEPAHDASGHAYESNPDWVGTCRECNWIHPDAKSPTGCDHTLLQHGIRAYNAVKPLARFVGKYGDRLDEDEIGKLQAVIHSIAEQLGLETDVDPEILAKFEEDDDETPDVRITLVIVGSVSPEKRRKPWWRR